MTEADYLRRELIQAKGLLAEAAGLMEAATTLAPDFAKLDVCQRWRDNEQAFRRHGVAVLPEGVKANG